MKKRPFSLTKSFKAVALSVPLAFGAMAHAQDMTNDATTTASHVTMAQNADTLAPYSPVDEYFTIGHQWEDAYNYGVGGAGFDRFNNGTSIILAQATGEFDVDGEDGQGATVSVALESPASAEGTDFTIGPVIFGAPWVLLGFLSFPALWFLMRSTPPTPRREGFPAIRLLFDLQSQDQEPAKMPLWQRLLRLALAGAVITGMADPKLTADQAMSGEGPVLILVDNGWASAPHWEDRLRQIEMLIDQAGESNRPVSIITTAMPEDGGAFVQTPPVNAAEARSIISDLDAVPWPVDRAQALSILEDMQARGTIQNADIFWLSNGLDSELTTEFSQFLDSLGDVSVFLPQEQDLPFLITEPSYEGDILRVDVRRALQEESEALAQTLNLSAYDEQGRPIMQSEAVFEEGQDIATATFRVPLEVRNDIARISINGEEYAGATLLMDERWRLRPVGVIEAPQSLSGQDLLREDNYVFQALNPHADVTIGGADDILSEDQSVIVMPDSASLSEGEEETLRQWVENGGTLLRFAGPRLGASLSDGAPQDSLLPVPLREGVRVLNENFAGAEPQPIGEFSDNSPFANIDIQGDVTVTRQILAEPSVDLDRHVWARLEDGTPIITARQIGEGWSVLVHTTGNTDWSNLVLSGMFVEIMRGVVSHSQGLDQGLISAGALEPPLQSLDTQGRLTVPPAVAQSISAEVVEAGEMSALYPAGYYGTDSARFAYNIASVTPELSALNLDEAQGSVDVQHYVDAFDNQNLKGMILTAAFMLAITDMGIMLGQRGALPMQRRRKWGVSAPKIATK